MGWYRIAQAKYPRVIAERVFEGEEKSRWPNYICLETSQKNGPVDAVNVVYYRDIETGEECGDFFFENVEEAIFWCSEALEISKGEFIFFSPFLKLD